MSGEGNKSIRKAAPFSQWPRYFTRKLSEQRDTQRRELMALREANRHRNDQIASGIKDLRRVLSIGDVNEITSAINDLFRGFDRIERPPRPSLRVPRKKSPAKVRRPLSYDSFIARAYEIQDAGDAKGIRKPPLAERVQLELEIFEARQVLRTLEERYGRFFGKNPLPEVNSSQGTIYDSLDQGIVGDLLCALLDRNPEPFTRVASVLAISQTIAKRRQTSDKMSPRRAAILAVEGLWNERFRALTDDCNEPAPRVTVSKIKERAEKIYREHEAKRTGTKPEKVNYPSVDWSKLGRELGFARLPR